MRTISVLALLFSPLLMYSMEETGLPMLDFRAHLQPHDLMLLDQDESMVYIPADYIEQLKSYASWDLRDHLNQGYTVAPWKEVFDAVKYAVIYHPSLEVYRQLLLSNSSIQDLNECLLIAERNNSPKIRIPENIAKIITLLSDILNEENFQDAYKKVYLSIKKDKKMIERNLVESAIDNALSILKKHHSASFGNSLDLQRIIMELTDYKRTITESEIEQERVQLTSYITKLKQLPEQPADNFEKLENDIIEEECPICLESLKENPIITTLCKHKFHSDCLSKWKGSCPLCQS